MLPFFDDRKLFDAIDLEHRWDSARNAEHLTPVPHGLKCHSREDDSPDTQLFAVISPTGFWRESTPIDFTDIHDRTAQTLVLVELDLPGIPWMSPNDIRLEELIAMLERNGQLPSPHPAGVHMSFADVSVHCIPHEQITPEFLRAIVSIDGGEVISEF